MRQNEWHSQPRRATWVASNAHEADVVELVEEDLRLRIAARSHVIHAACDLEPLLRAHCP
jgi:hypothetical protein